MRRSGEMNCMVRSSFCLKTLKIAPMYMKDYDQMNCMFDQIYSITYISDETSGLFYFFSIFSVNSKPTVDKK